MLAVYLSCLVLFSRSLTAALAMVLISVAATYILVINSMVFDYLDLVARRMTFKERAARMIAVKEVGCADFKNDPVPIKLRIERYWDFFCVRKGPESVIEADATCWD